jgi:cyclophilin family peptidyl-prolyl cis-trans isomerase
MESKNLIIIVAVVIVAALALWGVSRVAKAPQNISNGNSNVNMDNSQANNSANSNANANTEPASLGCTRDFNPEVLKEAKAPTEQFVTFTVKDFGTFKIQLYPKDAPKASENMTRLVKAGYYNCITFHRVAHGFVIQTGDPTRTGKGGDSAFGKEFADELNPATPSFKTGYVKGIVAMANPARPNANTSQFFITLNDLNTSLGKNYTIFGKVVSGQEVVDKIGQVEVEPGPFGSGDGAPLKPVVIEKAVLSAK